MWKFLVPVSLARNCTGHVSITYQMDIDILNILLHNSNFMPTCKPMSFLHQKLKLQFCFCECFSSNFSSYILYICVVRKMMKYKKCKKGDTAFCKWYISFEISLQTTSLVIYCKNWLWYYKTCCHALYEFSKDFLLSLLYWECHCCSQIVSPTNFQNLCIQFQLVHSKEKYL